MELLSFLSKLLKVFLICQLGNVGFSEDGRRWRDLMLHHQERIGDVRMREESVRVRVLALVNATLELERLTDGLVAGREGKLLKK